MYRSIYTEYRSSIISIQLFIIFSLFLANINLYDLELFTRQINVESTSGTSTFDARDINFIDFLLTILAI